MVAPNPKGSFRNQRARARGAYAIGKVYADGIKPMEFGGGNGTADIAKAVLAAL
jgi:hypothetical protein